MILDEKNNIQVVIMADFSSHMVLVVVCLLIVCTTSSTSTKKNAVVPLPTGNISAASQVSHHHDCSGGSKLPCI
jgi:hypothetical protein